MFEVRLSPLYRSGDQYRLAVVNKKWYERLLSTIIRRPRTSQSKKGSCRRTLLIIKRGKCLRAIDDADCAVVRRIEYSNTLLLASCSPTLSCTDDSANEVLSSLNALFEFQLVQPSRDKILTLLGSSCLTLDELNHQVAQPQCVHSFSDLCVICHCAPQQLSAFLISKGAIVHNNNVRLLDSELVYSCVMRIIRLCSQLPPETSWTHFVDNLNDFPRVVVSVVQRLFRCEHSACSDCTVLNLLDPLKTAIAIAGHVFTTHHKTKKSVVLDIPLIGLNSKTFFDEWIPLVPTEFFGFNTFPAMDSHKDLFLDFLQGFVIHKGNHLADDGMLWWVPEDRLPGDLKTRLSFLFAMRPQWPASTLQAFLRTALPDDSAFPQAIQRLVREYRVPGKPVTYSSLPA